MTVEFGLHAKSQRKERRNQQHRGVVARHESTIPRPFTPRGGLFPNEGILSKPSPNSEAFEAEWY
jgi:hypothetical protein